MRSTLAALAALLMLGITAEAYKIVFLNAWHSKSHGRTMMYLAERLVQRGNEVAIYNQAHFDLGKMGKGVKVLHSLVSNEDVKFDPVQLGKLFWEWEMSPYTYFMPTWIGRDFLIHSLNTTALADVLATPWDLVIMDEMFAAGQGAIAYSIQERHGSRVSVFSTTIIYDFFSQKHGFGRNPVLSENMYIKGSHAEFDPERFLNRAKNSWEALMEMATSPITDYFYRDGGRRLGIGYMGIDAIYQRSEFAFSDYPRWFRRPVAKGHALIQVGENCPEPKTLTNDLLNFVNDESSKGTIYIAFGSIVQWDTGPKDIQEVFIRVFNRFPEYRIIWAYNGRPLSGYADHIRILPWAPQDAILAHPRTVLFFTHGGIKSLKEGICGGVPLLVLPFFADQVLNAAACKRLGFALSIYKRNISEIEMETKMRATLENEPLFKRNVEKYRSYFVDTPMNPLDEGSFRVERILRIPEGAFDRYIRIKSATLGWSAFLLTEHLLPLIGLFLLLSK